MTVTNNVSCAAITTTNLTCPNMILTNLSINNASFLAVNISTSVCNILKFLYNGTLSTTYYGARVVLWLIKNYQHQ